MGSWQDSAFVEEIAPALGAKDTVKAKEIVESVLAKNPNHLSANYTQLYINASVSDSEELSLSVPKTVKAITELLTLNEQRSPLQHSDLKLIKKICLQIIEIVTIYNSPNQLSPYRSLLNIYGCYTARIVIQLNKMFGVTSEDDSVEVDFLQRTIEFTDEKGNHQAHFRHPSPLMLQIEPTNSCNLKCTMCTRNEMSRSEGMMSEALFDRILSTWSGHFKQYQLSYLLEPSIFFNGYVSGGIKFFFLGEPLLNKNIFSFIEKAREAQVNTGLQTNATLLSHPNIRAKLLKAKPANIGVSLDGISQETYENIRIGASWSKTVEALHAFHNERQKLGLEKEIALSVSTILPDDNPETKERCLEFLKEIEGAVDEINPIPLNRDYEQDFYSEDGSMKTYSKRSLDIIEVLENKAKEWCTEPLSKLNVLWDGTVTPCCFDVSGEIKLASVQDQGIDEIWNGPALRHFIALHERKLDNYPGCVKCGAKLAIL
jgi:radical SAM protein with 4Fe4S-binding SPASM domain